MRTMTWEEIDKDWSGLQKRHRMEIAQAVARYCVGHKMKDVAERLNYSLTWVHAQLDMAGVGTALGGSNCSIPITGGTSKDVSKNELPRMLREFGPTEDEQSSDDFEAYLQHYVEQGHEPAAATRLAKAEWAAEAAAEAGVIKEAINKRNQKVNQILFPSDSRDSFEIDFKMHEARMKSFIRFLDEAKINHLRRKATCERVASLHEGWLEQYERILNFHPTLNKDV